MKMEKKHEHRLTKQDISHCGQYMKYMLM